LDQIKGDRLSTIFDRFTTTYTLYNGLYTESYKLLKKQNNLSKKRYSEFEKATDLVLQYNNADEIVEHLEINNHSHDISQVVNSIRNEIFCIFIIDGIPQKQSDIQLVDNFNNSDNYIKTKALLSLIYKVRCNLLHGSKHFEEIQRLLLEPLTRILQTIVNLQIEKLKNSYAN